MKTLLKVALHRLGFDLRRRRPHHESSDVEELGPHHLLQVLLGSIRENEEFSFIQIGANDGGLNDRLSPFLSRRKLRGVMVEPQAKPFDALRAKYGDQDNIILHRGAVDARTGTRTLYRLRDDIATGRDSAFLSQLASFNRDKTVTSLARYARALKIRLPMDDAIMKEVVPTITLADLVVRYDLKSCDLLMIDTEGHDFEIIKSIDFGMMRPMILMYEHRHLGAEDRLACWRLLRSKGYRCAADWMDTIALHEADLIQPRQPATFGLTASAASGKRRLRQ